MKQKMNWFFQISLPCLLSWLVFTSMTAFSKPPLPLSHTLSTHQLSNSAPLIIPSPPHLNAKAYVLMDANSGAILAQHNMNKLLPPASLTKLMTLYVTSQALAQGQIHLDDKVRISKNAWSRHGSRMFLKEGSYVSIQKLIEGIIVASGNDACVAIAQYIGGSENSFAQLMNRTAQQLGMKNSYFTDSTGLPRPNHHSTAYDLALLTRALIDYFPQYYGWYQQKWIKYNKIKQPNRNRLLWRDPSVDGLKTGHTDAAGYCLISSAQRHGMRLISVVMGAPSDAARFNDSQSLLNWGYRYYHTYSLFKAHVPLIKARVYFAQHKNMAFGLEHTLYVTIAPSQYPLIKTTIKQFAPLQAPITKGHVYGSLKVDLKDHTIVTLPLIALDNDARAGWFSRSIDHITLFFKKIF